MVDAKQAVLESLRARFAKARMNKTTAKKVVDQLLRDFQADHAALFGELEFWSTEMENAEEELRAAVVRNFQATGEKAPIAGLGIRETTEVNYDAEAAFQWALGKQVALSLDKKAFEALAKANPAGMPVQIRKEPVATIARVLPEETEL